MPNLTYKDKRKKRPHRVSVDISTLQLMQLKNYCIENRTTQENVLYSLLDQLLKLDNKIVHNEKEYC